MRPGVRRRQRRRHDSSGCADDQRRKNRTSSPDRTRTPQTELTAEGSQTRCGEAHRPHEPRFPRAGGCIDRTPFGRGETHFGLATEASKCNVLTCASHIDLMELGKQGVPDRSRLAVAPTWGRAAVDPGVRGAVDSSSTSDLRFERLTAFCFPIWQFGVVVQRK